MNKGKSKFCGLAATALLAAAVMTSAGIGNFSALAEGEPSKEPVAPERFEAVDHQSVHPRNVPVLFW